MSSAGLTNGAFYSHFESKDDLVSAVLSDALEQRLRYQFSDVIGCREHIRDYLSSRHRDRAGSGCPTAALVADVARHSKVTREIFTKKISQIFSLMAAHLRTGTAAERDRRAIAIYGLIVGSLQLSRAVTDRKMSDDILDSAIEAALILAGER
jgi:AcrR family transcriptional regulator